jgi:hypothetical protein
VPERVRVATFAPPPEAAVPTLIPRVEAARAPSAFAPEALFMCTFVAAAFAATALASMFFPLAILILWFLDLVVVAYFFAYSVKVFTAVAAGQHELPETPSLEDMTGMLVRYLALGISMYGATAACLVKLGYAAAQGGPGATLWLALAGAAGVLGTFLWPMAFVATSVLGSAGMAFNYPVLVRSIARTFLPYLALAVINFVGMIIPPLGTFAVQALVGPEHGIAALTFIIGAQFVRTWASTWIEVNLAIQAGQFFRAHRTDLGWFS